MNASEPTAATAPDDGSEPDTVPSGVIDEQLDPEQLAAITASLCEMGLWACRELAKRVEQEHAARQATALSSAPPGVVQALDAIAQDVWFGGRWGTIARELDRLTGRRDTSEDTARMAVSRWVQRHPEWRRLNAAGKPVYNLTLIAAAMTGR